MNVRVLVLAVVLAACHRGGKKAPNCGDVGKAFISIATSELDIQKPDEATRRALEDQLPAMRDALVNVCTMGKWSDGVRTCLAAATTHAAIQACEEQLTDEQRRALASGNSW